MLLLRVLVGCEADPESTSISPSLRQLAGERRLCSSALAPLPLQVSACIRQLLSQLALQEVRLLPHRLEAVLQDDAACASETASYTMSCAFDRGMSFLLSLHLKYSTHTRQRLTAYTSSAADCLRDAQPAGSTRQRPSLKARQASHMLCQRSIAQCVHL